MTQKDLMIATCRADPAFPSPSSLPDQFANYQSGISTEYAVHMSAKSTADGRHCTLAGSLPLQQTTHGFISQRVYVKVG